jgi:hypothetical protein
MPELLKLRETDKPILARMESLRNFQILIMEIHITTAILENSLAISPEIMLLSQYTKKCGHMCTKSHVKECSQ